MGLVEETGEPAASATADDAAEGEDSRVRECVEALDRLGVPVEAGAPTARVALQDSDLRFSNDTIAAAVRLRKDTHQDLSGTVGG